MTISDVEETKSVLYYANREIGDWQVFGLLFIFLAVFPFLWIVFFNLLVGVLRIDFLSCGALFLLFYGMDCFGINILLVLGGLHSPPQK